MNKQRLKMLKKKLTTQPEQAFAASGTDNVAKEEAADFTEENSTDTGETDGLICGDAGCDVLEEETALQADVTRPAGKFRSADDLWAAYSALQAEFTRRCQKLKELGGQLDAVKRAHAKLVSNGRQAIAECAAHNGGDFGNYTKIQERVLELLSDSEFVDNYVRNNEFIKAEIIADYLKSLSLRESVRTLNNSHGYTALTPVNKPKTLEEAKVLAEKFFGA